MAIGNYLRNKILDLVFRNVTFTTSPVYISLHTADPGTTGTSEVSSGSPPVLLARQQVAAVGWNAAAAGLLDNVNVIAFPNMPAVTITHVGVWDAATGGNFLWGGPLTASKTVASGATFQINAGMCDVTLT